ncbi:MAG: NAD(P)-dependent alcohol dehydrogenase [Sediminibacterium sp. Gen4]|jgi:alcohol dehydrogenase (NADP+)|uniref:NAD(P)-dependent alcohol dehydrogenase n=1 Tax=unclassified Sediminibacterium TaxID=2635961 RepID=UPI0015BB226B|nr:MULTISPECIES: NAD(P)-dependent alcohol dehydrogenase [unclassified Sediminibacterium]MBW0165860.1 NAD(P)-dependent alcohol dehydrogenase [Sediminibacterium sp.]NWK64827.1 NAD(P)-dependent alcohol dehydrogenase [Sediminibacterium sp. Gen4]
MIATKAYAAPDPKSPLGPFSLERRNPGPKDVQIEILYCGVCHSDIHQVRDEWGGSIFPMVPGHEIVGRVTQVGNEVTHFKVGDLAGVGCFVDSCRTCENCKAGIEQYCEEGMVGTYNGRERGTNAPTYGGYSTQIVVDEQYTLRISDKLPLAGVAPLLCAGITTYSPLRHVGVTKGHRVAVLGLGGLGHMAVKFAASFGAEVTMLSSSPSKEADAKKLGAHHFALTSDAATMKKLQNHFDFILNTVSAPHDYSTYLNLLRTNGTMIVVGVPPSPSEVPAFNLIMKRRSIIGSLIGGIKETQEMLDYCAEHHIVSDVEVIPMEKINEAYERMLKADVRYRFVIDLASLK